MRIIEKKEKQSWKDILDKSKKKNYLYEKGGCYLQLKECIL